ncbi:purine and uridine phosphorylase [Aspergillus sclerotioniger CBS 115572]|uniref:Purine and uridine phosphorylase n=1 Tax=Aspergillus sclerotioniger CBS 115572 TaxID=1450535 RepID=A0A317VLL3_9EURO|nr:purine and uridine phosphorylase [Aspergillus sclerotioniger CBS 115572]PWY73828.1 purine and uridine phosphorylase [Aspergillus sclerotioniger CBS 115572]
MATLEKSPFANDEYTVGWVCALPIEFAAARGMIDEEHGQPQSAPAESDKNSYFLGSMGKFKTVVACLPLHQLGSPHAVAAAKEMLFTFPKIRVGLLVGTGAGIPDIDNDLDIRLGDVVIGSSPGSGGVIVYDFGKIRDGEFESLSVLNRPPKALGTALGKLQALHESRENMVAHYVEEMLVKHPLMRKNYTHPGQSSDRLFQANYRHVSGSKNCNKCEASQHVEREPRLDENPVIHYGTIASGNKVVKDAAVRDEIRDRHGAMCLDMEAAGLMNNFPCVVIRGIANYGDSHKNDRWQRFAAAAAAGCAKELMQHIQMNSLDGEPAAKDLLSQVHDEIAKISSFAITGQTRQVLEWLTPLDFDKCQNDYMRVTEEGTGLWLLKSPEFTQWMSRPNQTLFCPGIPGAGKTCISAIVVEHLRKNTQENPEIQACYIFCSYQPSHQQRNADIMLNLLRQLAVKGSSLLANIENIHKRHSQDRTIPTAAEIESEILRTAKSYEMIYIAIDALDEYCTSAPDELHNLLTQLFNLQENAPVNIFATSRFNTEIMARFEGCLTKEIQAHPDDIEKYINRKLPGFLSKISSDPEIQQSVRHEVVKRADGMFLLAKLDIEHLIHCPSRGALKKALFSPSYDQKSLEMAYQKAITRITSQKEECFQIARSTLAWLTYSRRALFAKELQHALGTELGKTELDPDFLPPLDIIDSLCAGLVVFDRNSGIIRLAHYTTKEFLIGNHLLQNAETEITQVAITYLSFSSGRSSDSGEYTHQQQEYPLHHYVAQHWMSHASAALAESNQSEKLINFILQFLNKESNAFAAGQAMISQSYPILGDEKNHPVAYGGLTEMTSRYIDSNEDIIKTEDSECKTPPPYAAQRGHLDVVEYILKSGNVRFE